jgi:hypothetical protein
VSERERERERERESTVSAPTLMAYRDATRAITM